MATRQQMQASTDGRQAAMGIMIQESLLPAPEDLAKFKDIDESIVKWMMQHADKEQATRIMAVESAIKNDAEKILLAKKEQGIVLTSLWLAFLIAISFIALSGILIYSGMEIAGSVFGGAALLLCVQAFLKFGRKQRQ
ncbi:MAG: hypothetical protein FWF63_10225 [Fibromonadales bacterium]|nr:hypothetical protein [Fibromonadales bacterium]